MCARHAWFCYLLSVETTRATIVEILRHATDKTVEDLTQLLALAPATVRRHLDILQRDGYVQARPVRGGAGRPHHAFSLTDAAQDLMPHHYIRVTSRLMQQIVSLRPADTRGRSGREIAGLIFERMADGLVRTCRSRVTGETLGERIDQARAALADEGIVFDVTPANDAYLVVCSDCPCSRLADGAEVCHYDDRLLASLLDADVQPVNSDDEMGCCAYLVRSKTT